MDVLAEDEGAPGSLADVTESGSKIARFKIEVANLDRKLGIALRRVGERAWQLQSEGRTDVLGDPEVRRRSTRSAGCARAWRSSARTSSATAARATAEAGRAARIVKEEAGRAAAAVREEVERAGAPP